MVFSFYYVGCTTESAVQLSFSVALRVRQSVPVASFIVDILVSCLLWILRLIVVLFGFVFGKQVFSIGLLVTE